MLPVIAEIVRSGFVEGHHHGSVLALEPDGEVTYERGEIRTPILPRSCNKPLQAVGMLRLGLDLDGELLALACGSHSGEDFHVAGVRRILAAAGLDESALRTPPDWPLLQLPNVTLTPHIAGASVRTVTIAAEQVAEEVRRFLAGEPPLNPC